MSSSQGPYSVKGKGKDFGKGDDFVKGKGVDKGKGFGKDKGFDKGKGKGKDIPEDRIIIPEDEYEDIGINLDGLEFLMLARRHAAEMRDETTRVIASTENAIPVLRAAHRQLAISIEALQQASRALRERRRVLEEALAPEHTFMFTEA